MPGGRAGVAGNQARTLRGLHQSLETNGEEEANEADEHGGTIGRSGGRADKSGTVRGTETRRHVDVRDQRGDSALRLPRQRYLRDTAFRGAVLFDAARVRSRQVPDGEGRPR